MLRLICSFIIIVGFVYLGRIYAEREKSRLSQLNSFCDGLNMLDFNIRYMSFPMKEALRYAGESCQGAVRKVFENASDYLFDDIGISSGEAFCKSVDKNRKALALSDMEIEILKSFAASLGKGDKDAEIVNIQAAKTRLSAACEEAKSDVNRKAKAAKGISTLIGVFIVIVLF